MMAGTGPAGLGIVSDAGSLDDRRVANAMNAATAIVPTEDTTEEVAQQADQDGSSASDAPETVPTVAEPSWSGDLLHLPRGLSVMLLEPYPWQWETSRKMPAGLETLLWYPLVAFALLGVKSGYPHARVLAFPLLAGGGSLLTYALVEGNFGTAFRHRGELVWVVALFAALGLSEVTQGVASRRNRT